jgi:hypothetical protein
MRNIIIGLLLLLSVGASAQWQQTGSKVRYVNGLGIPTKDTAAGVSADSSQILIRPADSALYIKYKRTWIRVGGGGGSIGGTGTINYVPKFTASGFIGNSLIYDNGTSVGINTLTPTTTLQVGDGTGNPEITASGLNYDVVLGTPSGSALGFTTLNNFVGVYSNSSTKDLAFTHGNSKAITFGTGNQTRLTITESGRLLFNTKDNGSDNFQVGGSLDITSAAALLTLNSTATNQTRKLYFRDAFGGASSESYIVSSTKLHFGAGGASRIDMTLSAAGNLLINTTTDNGVDKLQVNGSARVEIITVNNNLGQLGDFNSTNANGGYLTFSTSGSVLADLGTSQQIFGIGGNSTFGINARGAKNLVFGSNNTERVRITSGGNFLINTTTDNGVDKLQANGSILSTQFKLSALNTAPATASSTGTLGEIRIDANYIYICTATNTWKRVAIATW